MNLGETVRLNETKMSSFLNVFVPNDYFFSAF